MPRFSDVPRPKGGPGSALSSSIGRSRRVFGKKTGGVVSVDADAPSPVLGGKNTAGNSAGSDPFAEDDLVDSDDGGELSFPSRITLPQAPSKLQDDAVEWQKESSAGAPKASKAPPAKKGATAGDRSKKCGPALSRATAKKTKKSPARRSEPVLKGNGEGLSRLKRKSKQQQRGVQFQGDCDDQRPPHQRDGRHGPRIHRPSLCQERSHEANPGAELVVEASVATPSPTAPPVTARPTRTDHRLVPPLLPSPLRRAVAVDTRCLQTFEGDAASASFLGSTLDFLRSAARRGALPTILAATHATLNTRSGGGSGGGGGSPRTVIEARAARLPAEVLTGRGSDDKVSGDGDGFEGLAVTGKTPAPLRPSLSKEERTWSELLKPVLVRLPANHASNIQDRSAVRVPKTLLAHDTWRLLGDLVDAVVSESKRGGQPEPDNGREGGESTGFDARRHPLDVTIFASDISLFTDSNVDSHRRGLNRFWEKMREAFRTGTIRSIVITVVETGAVALATLPSSDRSAPQEDRRDCNKGGGGGKRGDCIHGHRR